MIFNIEPKYLKLIQAGAKKIEFRDRLYTESPYISLRNLDTNKVESVIEVFEVIDTKDFPEDEKEEILHDAHVDTEFSEQYDCRYAYLIKNVHSVH